MATRNQRDAKKNSLNAPVIHGKCLLAKVREALGVSQPEMAKRIGISASGLWKLEQGTAVKLSVARKIAKHYGKTVEELWPGDPELKTKK